MSDFYGDLKQRREAWKAERLYGGYTPEQVDYRKFQQKEREDKPPVPSIPEGHWYSHCLLLAQTRFGKTNAISWRIAQLLPQVAAGKATLIVMEPKGVLTRDLLHLTDVYKMRDRVVLIDPASSHISINLFDPSYGEEEAIARITRIMGTITTGMTDIQRDNFSLLIRVLYELPDPPTLRRLIDLLRLGKDAFSLDALTPDTRDFLVHDFNPKTDGKFLMSRLRTFLASSVFKRLFMSERSNFDMLEAMQGGKLIIIKAAGSSLAGNVSLYGRIWIEQVAKCIWPRLDILDENDRIPTTFIVDEAQDYIASDKHLPELLDKAGEAKIGIMFAMHHMAQIKDDGLKQSIYTNTSIKFASRTSADIHNLSGSMGDREGLPKILPSLKRFHFFMYHPDINAPEKVMFPQTEFKKWPRISEEEYADFLKELLGGSVQPPPKEPEPTWEPISERDEPPQERKSYRRRT